MSTRIPFTDSCSMCSNAADKYLSAGTSGYVSGKGRFGGKALQVGGTSAKVSFPGNPATVFADFAFQRSTTLAGNMKFWQAEDAPAGVVQCSLAFTPTGQIQAYRGDLAAAIGSPSVESFPANVIVQLEIKATIDNAGLLQVRLNGNTTPIIDFSGDTQQGSNAYCNVQTLIAPSSINHWFSDIVMFDSGGSAPNDFIGNKRVYFLQPNSDSATGGLNQFSTSPAQSAGNHYLNVDDATPPGDSSYNFTAVVNDRESYRMPSLPATASGVIGINIWANWRIDDAGPHNAQISSRSVATDAFSADINVPASYAYANYFQATDPDTGVAWTPAAVGGATGSEIGVKLTS